ncbi:hypothetical protein [Novosphingobium sp. UBA1939]|nr:hypothetical protein [Novosphingobium sp. UBA1939]
MTRWQMDRQRLAVLWQHFLAFGRVTEAIDMEAAEQRRRRQPWA